MNTKTLFYIFYVASAIAFVAGAIVYFYIGKESGKWVIYSGGVLYIVCSLIRRRFLKKRH